MVMTGEGCSRAEEKRLFHVHHTYGVGLDRRRVIRSEFCGRLNSTVWALWGVVVHRAGQTLTDNVWKPYGLVVLFFSSSESKIPALCD